MRIPSVIKAGFYPAHPDAISGILIHLRMPEDRAGEVTIFDPCCGEGLAIKQIAEGLAVPMDRVYGIELDNSRQATAKANLVGANVLGPATYQGSKITGFCFSLAYVNPPFDDELGGGRREELGFIMNATHHLGVGGVLCAVLPYNQIAGKRDMCEWLDAKFEHICLYKFPDHCRPYHETVIFAKKRKEEIARDAVRSFGELHKMGVRDWPGYDAQYRATLLPPVGSPQPEEWSWRGEPVGEEKAELDTWELRWGWKPHTFRKCGFTDEELATALDTSPLNQLLTVVKPTPPKRPPLPLNKGHVALLLASGMLDGLVSTPEGNHVVRGTASKVEYISSQTVTENEETGAVTDKVVYSQKILLTIRVVDDTGVIRSFADDPPAPPEGEDATSEVESIQDGPGAVLAASLASSASESSGSSREAHGAIPKPDQWKVGIKTAADGDWSFNGMRYPTFEEAETAAFELSYRWLAVVQWKVFPANEDPNK